MTGTNLCPSRDNRYSYREGFRWYSIRSMTPFSVRVVSRLVRMFVAIPRSSWISSKRCNPSSRSRMMSSVHASPTTSALRAMGHSDSAKLMRATSGHRSHSVEPVADPPEDIAHGLGRGIVRDAENWRGHLVQRCVLIGRKCQLQCSQVVIEL